MVESKFGGDAEKVSPSNQEDKYRPLIIPSKNDLESNMKNDSVLSHITPTIHPFLSFLPYLVDPVSVNT